MYFQPDRRHIFRLRHILFPSIAESHIRYGGNSVVWCVELKSPVKVTILVVNPNGEAETIDKAFVRVTVTMK